MGNPKPVFFVHSRPVSWNPIPATVQQVTLADGTPVRVNNQTWDYGACKCLGGLQIRLTKFENEITIDFQDIRFKCMSPNAKKTDRTQGANTKMFTTHARRKMSI